MKTMKQALALLLVLALMLTLAACGKKDKGGDTTTTTTAGESTDASTTTTTMGSASDTTTTTTEGLLPDDGTNGTADNPFEIGGVLEFDAVVKAGGVTYYDVYRVDGTILTLKSKDATVTYEGKTYQPKNGVISFPVSSDDILNPVKLAIGNTGAADATFKVTFAYPKGTMSNPITLTLGDLVTEIAAGNETGVVYLYTAAADGALTVQDEAVTKGQEYDIELYNLTSGANRTLLEDGANRVVSVNVSKGDQIRVTFSVLPDDKNEYPAVTLKSTVGFTGGTAGEDKPKDATYTVTVKDKNGAAMKGVKLQLSVGGKKASLTTDGKGVATATLPAAEGTVTVTVPTGYFADSFTYGISAAKPSVTIVLTEDDLFDTPDEPTTTTKPTTTTTTKPGETTKPTTTTTTQPEVTTIDYSVTVLDNKGAAAGGITVGIYSGDTKVAEKTTNKQGRVTATLERGNYIVKLGGTSLQYDPRAAVLTASRPTITLSLGGELDTSKTLKVYDPVSDKDVKVCYLAEGATYVTLTPGVRNYFLFEPTRDGTFRFASSNTYAKIGYYGASAFVMTFNLAEDLSGNAFNMSIRETNLGNIYVIGIDAATNCSAAVVQVTRIGDPAWSIEDEPTVEYKGDGAPKQVTAPSGLTNVDIKSSTTHHLVYSEKDGYYHLDSQSGPVVYLQMDNSYASIVGLLSEFGNMTAYLYNDDGSFKAKEQYAPLMQEYVGKMDKKQRVYPLTKDLEYMIRNYGNSQNWWNEGEPGYLFEEVSGVNPANAWMFLFCYEK